jgi:hypothetical protein
MELHDADGVSDDVRACDDKRENLALVTYVENRSLGSLLASLVTDLSTGTDPHTHSRHTVW